MQAGRELDALVAEKVMGCSVAIHAIDDPHCGCQFEPGKERPHASHLLADCHSHSGLNCDLSELAYYSTDIAAAWTVVNKLTGEGSDRYPRGRNISILGGVCEGSYCVHFECRKWEAEVQQAEAETLPLAICLAALQAVGAPNPA